MTSSNTRRHDNLPTRHSSSSHTTTSRINGGRESRVDDSWQSLGYASAVDEESQELLAECEQARWRAQVGVSSGGFELRWV